VLEYFISVCAVDTKLALTTVKECTRNCFRRLAHMTNSLFSSCRRSADDTEVPPPWYLSVRGLLIIICTLTSRTHKKKLTGSGMANEKAQVPLLVILAPKHTHWRTPWVLEISGRKKGKDFHVINKVVKNGVWFYVKYSFKFIYSEKIWFSYPSCKHSTPDTCLKVL